jgi:hypothetical protein
MRDAITVQSYQCPTVSTIAPGHKTVKSNLQRIAFQLSSPICRVAAISRKMIVFGASLSPGDMPGRDQRGSDRDLRRRRRGIAGIGCSCRFDQEEVGLLLGDRAVFDALGHDEELAGAERDIPVAQSDAQPPLENEEEVVAVGMGVPDEFALQLHDHDVMAVKLATIFGDHRSSKVASLL